MSRVGSGNVHAFIDNALFSRLSLMRKFRHYVMLGYGFNLDHATVSTALEDTPDVVEKFLLALKMYLQK